MDSSDVTIEILKSIRDGVTQMALRIDETHARIDETHARIDELRDDLSRRIVESELRTATAITDLAGTVREMTGILRSQSDVRPRLEKCERDIVDLQRRLGRG
jgi:hypothetical protein